MEVDLDVNINKVYVPHLKNHSRVQIYYGGTGSGKSVFLAQRAVLDLLAGGRNYLICRAVGKYIKSSVWMEVQRVIREWEVEHLFDYQITDRVITCKNGFQIIFVGLDDVEKLKSIAPYQGTITDVWIEEATETDKRAVKQLFKRQRGKSDKPKRLTMSFNPILRSHWIYKEYLEDLPYSWEIDDAETDELKQWQGDDLFVLKTWYKHNRFLAPGDIEDLENEEDEYYYQVYTLGNWGILGNVIFTNWEIKDLSDMQDQFTDRRHGLDFGYASDPAALAATHYDSKKETIYVYDELYETGLTNDILAEQVKDIIGGDQVIADSSEPKSIAELRKYGVIAVGAKKGKGSVLHGIQWLQQQKIIVDNKCVNARSELMQYKWKEGRDGEPVSPPKPVDAHNHFIDGLRYAYEEDRIPADKLVAFV